MSRDWIEVEGASMRPFLDPGDSVAVEWDQPGPPAAGELVLGRATDGTWIVHRIVNARERLAKGDSSLRMDAPLEIWGRIVGIRRRGSGRERAYEAGLADRWIAALSLETIEKRGIAARARAALFRRAIWALARLTR